MAIGTYPTWVDAHAAAQKHANESGHSLGIEAPMPPLEREWTVRYLPKKANRHGCDARCEAVEPMP